MCLPISVTSIVRSTEGCLFPSKARSAQPDAQPEMKHQEIEHQEIEHQEKDTDGLTLGILENNSEKEEGGVLEKEEKQYTLYLFR